MALPQITKEVGQVLAVNASVLSVTTFSNLEILLKIFVQEVKGVKVYTIHS